MINRRLVSLVLSLVFALAFVAPFGTSAQEMAPPDHGVGQPAADADKVTVQQTVMDFEALVNTKDPDVFSMMTGDFASFVLPPMLPQDATMLLDMKVQDIGEVLTYPDGWVSVDLSFSGLVAPNAYVTQRWFLNGPQSRVIEQFQQLDIVVPEGLTSDTVTVAVSDVGVTLDKESVLATDVLVVNVENTGTVPYFTIVARLPDGVAVTDAPWVDLSTTTIGGLMVVPQGTDQAGYFRLDPGTYVLLQANMTQQGPVNTGYVASFVVAAK